MRRLDGILRRSSPLVLVLASLALPRPAPAVEVGFGKADLTPEVGGARPVWIAGYGNDRKATGVHDPLFARAVVLRDGDRKVALVSVDLVGFMYPNTKAVRRRLADFAYVLVASTHDHEGPDTIGLWGPSRRQSGVDPAYLERVEGAVVAAVRAAEDAAVPARAEYGTAADETLLRDSRLPIVKDPTLRVVRFRPEGDAGRTLGLLVQWNCHPESLGARNTLITADFPFYAIRDLEAAHGAPVAYFSGAVGGLMTTPDGRFPAADGRPIPADSYEYAEAYGRAVAALTDSALKAQPAPVALAPMTVSAKVVALPLANPGYRLMRGLGVLDREGFRWTGDPDTLGPPAPGRSAEEDLAIESEVAYLRLGDLHVAAIPGELYPELVTGRFQDPVEPNADFPEAPLEPAVLPTLPGPKALIFGLANDEVGYIIPKRQWDDAAPFAYGRQEKQYGEVNSLGPEAAPILMNALRDCVRRAAAADGDRIGGAGASSPRPGPDTGGPRP